MTDNLESRIKAHPIYLYTVSMCAVVVATVGVLGWLGCLKTPIFRSDSQNDERIEVRLDPQTILTSATNQIGQMNKYLAGINMATPQIESLETFRLSMYQHQAWAAGFLSIDDATLYLFFKTRASPELFRKYKDNYFGATESLNAMATYFQEIAEGKKEIKSLTQSQVDREFIALRNIAEVRIADFTGFIKSRSVGDFK
jgi:hypothetical protein